MLRSVYPIQVENTADHKIVINRIFYNQFVKHLTNYFGVDSIIQVPLFGIIETRFFDKIFQFSFDEFFAPEIYFIFKSLYEKYSESDYLEVCKQLTERTWIKSIFVDNIQKPSNIDERLGHLKSTLLAYQRQYIDTYFESKQKLQLRGALLAYDQGLGKTITSLYLSYVVNEPQTIIICPLSLTENWLNEILGHVSSNASIGIVGKHRPARYKYVICSYERMDKIGGYLEPNSKFFMILDESHNVRYMNTQRTQNLLGLRDTYKIDNILALSGTPIKALATELIPILLLLDPRFSQQSTINIFNKIYGKFRDFSYHILQYRLEIMMERKLKTEVLTLPKKHAPQLVKLRVSDPGKYMLKNIKAEVVDYASKRIEELTKDKEKNYKYLTEILRYCVLHQIINKQEADYIYQIFVKMTGKNFFLITEQERKKLIPFYTLYDRLYNKLKIINPTMSKSLQAIKAATLGMNMKAFGEAMGRVYIPRFQQAIIDMFTNNGGTIINIVNQAIKKTIMFSTSVVALKEIHKYLNNINIDNILITGDTNDAVSSELDRFKTDNNIKILLASIQKLSTGVTITEANTCIFIDTPYRDADFQQAQDRIYRIGQDTEVFIYILTIDTGNEPNIITHNKEIMDWSGEITGTLIRK